MTVALPDNVDEAPREPIRVKVRQCDTCDQSLFHVSQDNRIVCATCHAFVEGWHALGNTYAS